MIWTLAVLPLAAFMFAAAFAAVFDLLDLTQPKLDRVHALRSLAAAVTRSGHRES